MDSIFGFLFFVVFVIIIIKSVMNQISGKSISKCPNCRKSVSKSAFTCPRCGAELKKKCKNCGQWLSITALNCFSCHALCDGVSAPNMNKTIYKYTQRTHSSKRTHTHNNSTNNSYNNNYDNNKVCTYHQTYSSGYNCDNKYNQYSTPSYSNLDDIGLIKGKKRNRVETVEDYERSRHKTGAYQINTNEVQSYDRKNSYSTRSEPVFRQKNANSGAGNKNKSGLIVVIIIIISMILLFVVPMACIATDVCSSISEFDWNGAFEEENNYDDTEETGYSYATRPYRNLDSKDIKNQSLLLLLNSIKNDNTLNYDDNMIIFSHYVEEEKKYQIVTMRMSESDEPYDIFLCYLKDAGQFAFYQYEVYNDDNPVMNSYVSENGIRFVQIDYFEYMCEKAEDISDFQFIDNNLPIPNLYYQECDYDLGIM